MRLTFIFVTALVLVTGLLGCNQRDAENISQDTKNLVRHTGEALGGAKLAASVNTVLALRKGVDMSGLKIEAQDGVVTVGGHVRNEEERRRVIETVNGIRGVERVVDKLRIEPR